MNSALPPEFVKKANGAVTKCEEKVEANITQCQCEIMVEAAN